MSVASSTSKRLSADLILEYPFTRTTGEVIGTFLTGLREKIIYGIRRPGGSVMAPPTEYDPDSGEALTEFVEVGPGGEVMSWTWCNQPRPQQPFEQPFAWALIKLDGSDTCMLHAVCVESSEKMETGMRVEAKWRQDRQGHITDIYCFEPK